MLKDVNNFIREIKSIEEKINLSLFEDFVESSSPADYAKMLMNIKNPDENKEFVAEIKDKILNLKDRIKEMSEVEKKCEWNITLKIIKKILDYIKMLKKCIKSW